MPTRYDHLDRILTDIDRQTAQAEADGAMRYRKLRIAWSVGCAIACVLLIAMWVRSYRRNETVFCPWHDPKMLIVSSWAGRVSVFIGEQDPSRTGRFPSGWGWTSREAMAPKQTLPFWTYIRDKYAVTVRFPHWPLLPAAAILVIAPWLRSRGWRYSLRTLLIATMLVAVVLGLIVWATR